VIDVSIVVVSYNTKEMTLDCLRSIYAQSEGFSFNIIVVDNASSDGSPEAIAKIFPEVVLVRCTTNLGFAAGNNKGFLHATGRYVLLLNSDTLILDNAIKKSVTFMASNPKIGVLGCRVILPDGTQQMSIFRDMNLMSLCVNIFFPNFIKRKNRYLGRSRYVGIDLDEDREVDVVAGCYMLVRQEVLSGAGTLDEDYFFYGEEAEWCYRIRQKGWKIIYHPKAEILHYGGGSTVAISSQKAYMMAKAQIMTLEKTKGKLTAYCGNLLMLFRDIPRYLLWVMLGVFPSASKLQSVRKLLGPSVARIPLQLRYLRFTSFTHEDSTN
jgi:GT2 family glycosyltransferase